MSRVSWIIAKRYFKSRKHDGFVSLMSGFSMIGIALGVATLIVVMAVMTGLKDDLLDRILGFRGHLNINPTHVELKNYETLTESLKQYPFVKSAIPLVDQPSIITVNNHFTGAIIHGLNFKELKAESMVGHKVIRGAISETAKEVGIGRLLAEKYHLSVGDQLTLYNPVGIEGPFGPLPRTATYPIGFIFDVGHKELDSTFVFMPLAEAQMFYNFDKSVSAIELRVDDPEKTSEYSKLLMQDANSEYSVYDWKKVNTGFVAALQIQKNVFFIVLSLIIVIAAFNIISSLTMLVQRKTKDIAILRTIGMNHSQLMRVFVMMGSLIGFIGTMAGLFLGLSIALNLNKLRVWVENASGWKLWHDEVFWLTRLPTKVVPFDVCLVVLIAFCITFLAALYPAWRAAKLDPVEALRYE